MTDHARQCQRCRRADEAAGRAPQRPVGAGPASDRCDVCPKRLPVAELAYRTLPPRRSGGTEALLVGHRACLDRRDGEEPTEGAR